MDERKFRICHDFAKKFAEFKISFERIVFPLIGMGESYVDMSDITETNM